MNTVKAFLDKNAATSPHQVFLFAPEAQQQLTWAELQHQTERLNEILARLGVGAQGKVAFLLDNGYWTTVLFLGVMSGGRVIVPLNAVAGLDPLDYVLEHCEAEVLFISPSYARQFSPLVEKFSKKLTLILTDEDEGLQGPDPKPPVPQAQSFYPIEPQNEAVLIYTSGTTGLPKGVLLTHQNVIAGGTHTAAAHGLSQTDRALCVLPLYHINGEMVTVMAPLVSGGSVVMPRRFKVSEFWSWIAHYQCTWFSAVPTIFSYLLAHHTREGLFEDWKTIQHHLKFGRSASSALPPATHQAFETAFQIPIVETMGLTETAAQILTNPRPPAKIKYGSPGQPYGNEVTVLGESGAEVAVGDVGEIVVRGENVMKGYYKNPEATAAAIDSAGWFHTGDLGYRDSENFFFITGRIKELIIKGGENIAPQEIDHVLYQHPSILEAAAFGLADAHYGQEVFACVVLRPEAPCTQETLEKFCMEKLGPYKTPKKIHFVEALPKGPSGKIQRLKLAAQLAQSKKTN